MLSRLRRLLRDREAGATVAVVIFTIGLTILLGLVIDVGRAYAERARLQAWLDSVSVAVAAQLDGRIDSILRAQWVADNAGIVSAGAFSQTGSAGTEQWYEVSELRFLSDMPETGLAGLTETDLDALVTNDPLEARFALLDAKPRTVAWSALTMLSSASASNDAFTLGARSVAIPIATVSCSAPVIAICAPPGGLEALELQGAQLQLTKNLNGTWVPGEYGVISGPTYDPEGVCDVYTGAEQLTCLAAIAAPRGQCPAEIDMRGGDGIDVAGALNTRFDIWAESVGHLVGHPSVPSDQNTISGNLYACNGAQYDVVSDSMALPDDPCFHNGTCSLVSPTVEVADLELYWEQTHGGDLPEGLRTRYDVYLHELNVGLLDPDGPEDSTNPMCNPNAVPQAGRRVIDLAVVDCTGLEGLEPTEVPVIGHLQALMTAPATQTAGVIATFDGVHQNEFMAEGDIVTQYAAPADENALLGFTVLSQNNHGAGNDNGAYAWRSLGQATLKTEDRLEVRGFRDSGEWVRLDRIRFTPAGDGGGQQTVQLEDADLENFFTASGAGGAIIKTADSTATAGFDFDGSDGLYNVEVRLQDENDGQSTVELHRIGSNGSGWPSEDLRVIDDRGRLTYDPYRANGLVRIHVHQSINAVNRGRAAWRNVAMLFDTTFITGFDGDLASTQFGNVLIVSEDGDETDPDDEAQGGWLVFHWDRPTRVESLVVFDTEQGGVIRLYDETVEDPSGEFYTTGSGALQPKHSGQTHDPREMSHVAVPRLGDGKHVRMQIKADGVRTLAYFLPDSGALDEL
ncbi:MAG: Tad domain-containing protein, partial [Pseudomonadota bacterium]